jgi:methylglutaconyl-CoA hydratase
VATAKQLVQIANTLSPTDEDLGTMTASMIAALRVSTEGQEGLKAFLEKRKPTWQK